MTIAVLEDKQCAEKSKLYSFCPDLDTAKSSPHITTGPAGEKGSKGTAGETDNVTVSSDTNHSCGHGGHSTHGRGGSTSHGGHGGCGGCGGCGGGSVHDRNDRGSRTPQNDPIAGSENNEPNNWDQDEPRSDTDIPPASNMDTKSKGAFDMEPMDDIEIPEAEIAEYSKDSGPIIIDLDDSDDEYQEDAKLESTKIAKKEKAKAARTALQSSITAARSVQPQAPVKPLNNPAKRKGSNVGLEQFSFVLLSSLNIGDDLVLGQPLNTQNQVISEALTRIGRWPVVRRTHPQLH
ncbi:hypothetical protein VKT23_005227 [Stygiomarasmius scandens]|uniref:Uncharacterized protein n=1 Tax=Marasmiellus scandens TaxID=2682957 RepID=A0ABR1JUH2_9AGAR